MIPLYGSVAVSSSEILCSKLLCSVSYSVIRRLNYLSGNRPSVKFSYKPFIRSSKSIMRRFASNSSFLSSVLSFSHCNSYCAFNCSTNSFSSLRTYCDTLLVEVFFRQCKTRLALDTYQIRSSKGIQRYWLLMSMTLLYLCYGHWTISVFPGRTSIDSQYHSAGKVSMSVSMCKIQY